MNNLFSVEYKFNAYKILCDMVELSNVQINRMFNENKHIQKSKLFSDCTTSFCIGRQAGQTSAIIKYAKEHSFERPIYIITQNQKQKKNIVDKLETQNVNMNNIICLTENKNDRFSSITIILKHKASLHKHLKDPVIFIDLYKYSNQDKIYHIIEDILTCTRHSNIHAIVGVS